MWAMPAMQRLQRGGAFFVHYQQCAHGGQRDKWSSWLCSLPSLATLGLVCDGKHDHLPWGVSRASTSSSSSPSWRFATADEAEYPRVLCERTAALLRARAVALGMVPPPLSLANTQALDYDGRRLLGRAEVGLTPRGQRVPPVVPEYKALRSLTLTAPQLAHLGLPGTNTASDLPDVPAGSRILGRQAVKGVQGSADGHDDAAERVMFGIQWSPQEFIDQAKLAVHPADRPVLLHDELADVLHELLTKGPAEVARRRVHAMRRIAAREQELQVDEARLHASLHPAVARILKGKRLLLFKRLLGEEGYADTHLFEDLTSGFALTGMGRKSNVFVPQLRPMLITEQELMQSSKWSVRAALAKIRPSSVPAMDLMIWREVEEELGKGWLEGPYEQDQLASLVGSLFVVSTRFGLQQTADKCRAIDDYSASCVNSAYGTLELAPMGGVDELAGLARAVMDGLGDSDEVVIQSASGATLRGTRHGYFRDPA